MQKKTKPATTTATAAKKTKLLEPYLLEGIDRLRRLVELDAPAALIGAAAFSVFGTTLACYGRDAGWRLLDAIRDRELHSRGVCGYDDCTNPVARPDSGTCQNCLKELGIDIPADLMGDRP